MIPIMEIEVSDHHIEIHIETDLNRILHLDQIQKRENFFEVITHIIDLPLCQE